jgi:hypothetical protein
VKRIGLILCVAVLAWAAPAGAATPPQATTARACGSVKLDLGRSQVRAKSVRCADARRFMAGLLGRDCGETRDCNFTRFTFRGYKCVKRVSAKLTKNSCTRGRKAISELHA